MNQIPILMPQLGESIAEATIVKIFVSESEKINSDDPIFEIETNKASVEVPSICSGKVLRIIAAEGQSYPVGSILGYIELSEEELNKQGLSDLVVDKKIEKKQNLNIIKEDKNKEEKKKEYLNNFNDRLEVVPTIQGLPVPANATGASYLTPRMKARMEELGLNAADLSGVAGSGKGGRVMVKDFEMFLQNLEKQKMTKASSMRIMVADSMRRSWTRPLATVGSSVILDPVLIDRKKYTSIKPGPALYVMRALAIALKENTAVAGRLIGTRIVHPPSIDIGFAVEVNDGVLVPVIKEVDKVNLSDLINIYSDLIEKARTKKLPKEAIEPGIATVTNFGTFGIEWATPIPLPEQNLVLGLGMGIKKPVWSYEVNKFVPASEAGLTLSFDHRVLDGGGAGRLLSRVSELLKNPSDL